jgi:hypothetical protein
MLITILRVPAWRIYRLQGWLRAFVGVVTADTEEAAIKKGITEFKITNAEHQKGLRAERQE